jgi:hypothetical protein
LKSVKKCENFNGQAYSCNRFLRFIELQIIQLNKKLETIAHLTEHTVHTSRQRRGLFNGISTGLKWLIGAPDANDAEFYSAAIKTLQNKNRETLTLMRQQIHIMNSAIISYNNSVQSFKEIETKLNANIKTFNNFTKSVTKKVNQLITTQRATSHIDLLSHLVLELNEVFDVIIASILFAKQNIFLPTG